MKERKNLNSAGSKENKFLPSVFGQAQKKQPTKREIERDRKVEALLEAYKKQDEETMRKEHQKNISKKIN